MPRRSGGGGGADCEGSPPYLLFLQKIKADQPTAERFAHTAAWNFDRQGPFFIGDGMHQQWRQRFLTKVRGMWASTCTHKCRLLQEPPENYQMFGTFPFYTMDELLWAGPQIIEARARIYSRE